MQGKLSPIFKLGRRGFPLGQGGSSQVPEDSWGEDERGPIGMKRSGFKGHQEQGQAPAGLQGRGAGWLSPLYRGGRRRQLGAGTGQEQAQVQGRHRRQVQAPSGRQVPGGRVWDARGRPRRRSSRRRSRSSRRGHRCRFGQAHGSRRGSRRSSRTGCRTGSQVSGRGAGTVPSGRAGSRDEGPKRAGVRTQEQSQAGMQGQACRDRQGSPQGRPQVRLAGVEGAPW